MYIYIFINIYKVTRFPTTQNTGHKTSSSLKKTWLYISGEHLLGPLGPFLEFLLSWASGLIALSARTACREFIYSFILPLMCLLSIEHKPSKS